MTDPQESSHERFEADLVELALGVLDRRNKVTLLNHLSSCSSCAAEFEHLTSAAEYLLLLALEIDPPDGFESRFRDRIDFLSFGTCNIRESRFSLW